MTIEEFVVANRAEIDRVIRSLPGYPPEMEIDDVERELFVLNEESLYLWAKREGVEEGAR